MKQIRMQLVNGLCNLSYPAFVGMDLGRVQNVMQVKKEVPCFHTSVLCKLLLPSRLSILSLLAIQICVAYYRTGGLVDLSISTSTRR